MSNLKIWVASKTRYHLLFSIQIKFKIKISLLYHESVLQGKPKNKFYVLPNEIFLFIKVIDNKSFISLNRTLSKMTFKE